FLDGLDLLPELIGVGHAEVVADRGAAYIQAQASTATLQVSEVIRRRLREIVGGQLDRIEVHAGRQVDEVVEGHRRFRLALEVERRVEAVGRETESHVRGAATANRLDSGGRAGSEDQARAGEQRRLQELTA